MGLGSGLGLGLRLGMRDQEGVPPPLDAAALVGHRLHGVAQLQPLHVHAVRVGREAACARCGLGLEPERVTQRAWSGVG